MQPLRLWKVAPKELRHRLAPRARPVAAATPVLERAAVEIGPVSRDHDHARQSSCQRQKLGMVLVCQLASVVLAVPPSTQHVWRVHVNQRARSQRQRWQYSPAVPLDQRPVGSSIAQTGDAGLVSVNRVVGGRRPLQLADNERPGERLDVNGMRRHLADDAFGNAGTGFASWVAHGTKHSSPSSSTTFAAKGPSGFRAR